MKDYVKIANSGYSSQRGAIAEDPNIPPDLLIRLVEDENFLVRSKAIQNPSLSSETLNQRVWVEDSYSILAKIAVNPKLTQKSLRHLAFGSHERVIETVVNNPNFPLEWLEELIPLNNHFCEAILYREDLPPEVTRKAWCQVLPYIRGFAINKRAATLPYDLLWVSLFDSRETMISMKKAILNSSTFERNLILKTLVFLNWGNEETVQTLKDMPLEWLREMATSIGMPLEKIRSFRESY